VATITRALFEPRPGQREERESGSTSLQRDADVAGNAIAPHAYGLDAAQMPAGLVIGLLLPEILDRDGVHALDATRAALNKP